VVMLFSASCQYSIKLPHTPGCCFCRHHCHTGGPHPRAPTRQPPEGRVQPAPAASRLDLTLQRPQTPLGDRLGVRPWEVPPASGEAVSGMGPASPQLPWTGDKTPGAQCNCVVADHRLSDLTAQLSPPPQSIEAGMKAVSHALFQPHDGTVFVSHLPSLQCTMGADPTEVV